MVSDLTRCSSATSKFRSVTGRVKSVVINGPRWIVVTIELVMVIIEKWEKIQSRIVKTKAQHQCHQDFVVAFRIIYTKLGPILMWNHTDCIVAACDSKQQKPIDSGDFLFANKPQYLIRLSITHGNDDNRFARFRRIEFVLMTHCARIMECEPVKVQLRGCARIESVFKMLRRMG
jgi:hypothetical protein